MLLHACSNLVLLQIKHSSCEFSYWIGVIFGSVYAKQYCLLDYSIDEPTDNE